MAASSPAREQIHIRLSLDPETRALLERLAAIDERSNAHTASLLIKASLRARQGEVIEGAVQRRNSLHGGRLAAMPAGRQLTQKI